MKFLKWAGIVWSVLATLIVILAVLVLKTPSKTEAHIFCAYNRVFVEFDEDGKRWGTTMLDYNGRPIPCEEHDVKIENTI